MGRSGGGNTKVMAANAKKAEAQAAKDAVKAKEQEKKDAAAWAVGSNQRGASKAQAAADKQAFRQEHIDEFKEKMHVAQENADHDLIEYREERIDVLTKEVGLYKRWRPRAHPDMVPEHFHHFLYFLVVLLVQLSLYLQCILCFQWSQYHVDQ